MKKVLVFMMAVLMLAALAVAGCGGSNEKEAGGEKIMRVGTEPSFAPFEMQAEGSEELTGFDMDLIRAIGKHLGYKVEISAWKSALWALTL